MCLESDARSVRFTVTTTMISALKAGSDESQCTASFTVIESDESQFDASFIVRGSHKTVPP